MSAYFTKRKFQRLFQVQTECIAFCSSFNVFAIFPMRSSLINDSTFFSMSFMLVSVTTWNSFLLTFVNFKFSITFNDSWKMNCLLCSPVSLSCCRLSSSTVRRWWCSFLSIGRRWSSVSYSFCWRREFVTLSLLRLFIRIFFMFSE